MSAMTRKLISILSALIVGGALVHAAPSASRAEALPRLLAERLRAIEGGAGSRESVLTHAALALLEAGWLADSLDLTGGRLSIHGARRRPARFVRVRGEDRRVPWRSDSPLEDPGARAAAAETWFEEMDSAGHPFAQGWLRPLEAGGDSLLVEAAFRTGPSGPPGEVRILGLERLSEGFLARYLGLDPGEPLTLARARRGRNRLAASGWFRAVDEPRLGWDPVAGRVGLLLRVEERPRPNRVTALVGGGSGETSGALDVDLFSPFGAGRRWRLGADWLGRQRSRLDVDLREPSLFGRGLALDLGFRRVRQDSTYLQQSVQLDLRLLLPGGWEGLAGFGYERSLFEQSQTEMSRRRHRFGLAWRSLGPGPPGERRLRFVTDLLVKRSSLPGDAPSENQWEGRGLGLWTQRLRPPWKLRLRGGANLLMAGGEGFNVAELFPLGGALTLRGYDEEHFRGDRVAHGSLELAFGEPLELSLFLDYGWGRWIRRELPALDFTGWGSGLALRAPGPRGGLSLALALGESKRLADLRVHLALDAGF